MSATPTNMRSPLARVKGLGSAKEGVSHWWQQRLTAIALVPLSVWFIVWLIGLIGSDYDTATATLTSPWSATLLIIFTVAVFWHGFLGLSVVIEDYVSSHQLRLVLLIAVKFLAVVMALVSVVSILKVALQ